jgi:3'(2'), 5'-bisphosphate nucleotidase
MQAPLASGRGFFISLYQLLMNNNELLITAINAAIAGGVEILEVYHNEEAIVELKDDNSPLTQADSRSNDAIEAKLATTGIPILSEEGKSIAYADRSNWQTLWVVDPLDGTKEFIKRNGEFTVNIALVQNGTPILGVVYVPVAKDLYFAAEGIGSFMIGRVGSYTELHDLEGITNAATKLPIEQKRPFTVVGSRSHMNDETKAYIKQLETEHGEAEILSRGSSLKICMVAEGKADIYPRFAPTMEWDTAAGHAIAKYAGCETTLHNSNNPLVYNKKDLLNPWFIVKKSKM